MGREGGEMMGKGAEEGEGKRDEKEERRLGKWKEGRGDGDMGW